VYPTPGIGNFFNLLGFLKKKIPNPPKFSRSYKKTSKPLPRKISGYVSVFGITLDIAKASQLLIFLIP